MVVAVPREAKGGRAAGARMVAVGAARAVVAKRAPAPADAARLKVSLAEKDGETGAPAAATEWGADVPKRLLPPRPRGKDADPRRIPRRFGETPGPIGIAVAGVAGAVGVLESASRAKLPGRPAATKPSMRPPISRPRR